MNLNLFHLLGQYFIVVVISLMSTFNIGNYSEKNIQIDNQHINKDGGIINSVSSEIVTQENEEISTNPTNDVQTETLDFSYQEVKKDINVSEKEETKEKTVENISEVKAVEEQKNENIQKNIDVYTGKLVGYGPDCRGCSGEGYLACKTETGERFSLKYDGIYYTDDEYGEVRILAANKKFPCGTIIQVEKQDGTKFLAVVMDRVATTIENGELMDLAYSTQTDKTVFAADGLVGNNITFGVQRWGW